MNVLLLGTSDSVFIRDFCLYVLDKKYINTVILSPTLSKRYSRDYSGNNAHSYDSDIGYLFTSAGAF